MRSTRAPISLLITMAIGSAAVACSGGDDIAGPGGRAGIDPRSYYEDYQEATGEDGAVGAPAPSGGAVAEDAAGGGAPGADVPDPGHRPPEPGILDDNTFSDPGAGPFIRTADQPLSTFGFDVDTGSFTVGRTFLREGYLPEPDSVRTEEWINAFDYDYPAPGSTGEMAVHVDGAPSPLADGTHVVRVGARTADVAPEDRPDANLTLVVDTSGSMDIRERLGLVRSTLALFAVHLRETDTVSVVTFEDRATTLLPPTPVAEVDRIVATIDDLTPSGSTNLEAGLRRGYELAGEAFRDDALNTVILASDGVANRGVTGLGELGDLATRKADEGIRLVTVGYGMGNYRDDLMEQLADRGDGFYSYVDTYEEAEQLFATELTTTLTTVAAEARAQVRFDPDAVTEHRLIGYENRMIDDDAFEDQSEDTGELGAGHAVTALYEVRLAEGGSPDELGRVTVRHQPAGVGGEVGDPVERTSPITRDDLSRSFDGADAGLRLATTVAGFAELMGEHPVAVDRGVTVEELAGLAEGLDAPELTDLLDLARTADPPTTGEHAGS